MKNNKLSFNIIANAVIGYEGLSGGDNIFINFAKKLIEKGVEVNIFTWKHGFLMCQKNGLKRANFFLSEAEKFEKFPFSALYFLKTIFGIKKIKEVIKTGYFQDKKVFVYSASDFLPDSIPGYIFKKALANVKWLAGFYLFAPNPFRGFRGELRINNFIFWLFQKPIYWLVNKYADIICVTSEPDKQKFIRGGRKPQDLFVVKGGIDCEHLRKFQKPTLKIYDAVFVGRFHPQKGVIEMIDIWNMVVKEKTTSKLAIIGLGDMEKEMREKIKEYNLERNINFLGVMIGDDRNKILQQSKIILHPAVYDSGGMAAASGLACGLPGVCFDLPVFKTYYPKGFLYAKIGNLSDFADKIIDLLEDEKLYKKISSDAIEESKTWDWEGRADQLLQTINSNS